MNKLLFAFLLALGGLSLSAQNENLPWFTDMAEVKDYAAESGSKILMVFAGSDWCKPCIQFKKDILLSANFTKYAREKIAVLYLDFPAKKKNRLPKQQTDHNEALASKYNRSGVFPKIVLLDKDENILAEPVFRGQPVDEFNLLLFNYLAPSALPQKKISAQKKVLKLMGSRFEITAVADNDTIAWQAINAGIAEIQRIEKIISSWDPDSQTSEVNRQSGVQPIVVDQELYDLIYRAKKVSNLTQGAFDISYASMDKIWYFDGSMKKMPQPEKVATARSKINWQNIILDPEQRTVFLKEKGMKIGFGAIGKGYAANQAKAIMEKIEGVHGGVVNASGDLITWGKSHQPEGWTIKIADPKNMDNVLGWLPLKNMAIVTSGDYERFVEFDGKRYAHIIDPRTGYPTSGIKSVTIACPDAELADALATSVFVLGKEKGLELINQLNGVECLIITDEDDLLTSRQLQLNYY